MRFLEILYGLSRFSKSPFVVQRTDHKQCDETKKRRKSEKQSREAVKCIEGYKDKSKKDPISPAAAAVPSFSV